MNIDGNMPELSWNYTRHLIYVHHESTVTHPAQRRNGFKKTDITVHENKLKQRILRASTILSG